MLTILWYSIVALGDARLDLKNAFQMFRKSRKCESQLSEVDHVNPDNNPIFTLIKHLNFLESYYIRY